MTLQLQLSELIKGVKLNDPTAHEDLFALCADGTRFLLSCIPEADASDIRQEVYMSALAVIKENKLRSPESLLAYVRASAYRCRCSFVKQRMWSRERCISTDTYTDTNGQKHRGHDVIDSKLPTPEIALLRREQKQLCRRALSNMLPRDREIIERAYIREESADETRRAMNLPGHSYDNVKSRATLRLAERVRAACS